MLPSCRTWLCVTLWIVDFMYWLIYHSCYVLGRRHASSFPTEVGLMLLDLYCLNALEKCWKLSNLKTAISATTSGCKCRRHICRSCTTWLLQCLGPRGRSAGSMRRSGDLQSMIEKTYYYQSPGVANGTWGSHSVFWKQYKSVCFKNIHGCSHGPPLGVWISFRKKKVCQGAKMLRYWCGGGIF